MNFNLSASVLKQDEDPVVLHSDFVMSHEEIDKLKLSQKATLEFTDKLALFHKFKFT